MAVLDTSSSEVRGPRYEERIEMGRALREKVLRQAHADFQVSSRDRDPISILEESNQGRISDLIPIRYGRMLADPFAFLRGSAALMAYDLSRTPVSGIHVQACGDCHLANFGLFATPERNLVFDLNDFDETLPAPWEWDIKRLAASVVVAGRSLGISDSACEKAVFTLAETYRTQLRKYAKMRVLDVWYSRLDEYTLIQAAPDAEAREHRKRVAAKARASVTEYLFPKITIEKDGRRHIVDNPPLIFHMPKHSDGKELLMSLEAEYQKSLPTHLVKLFEHYHFEDYAFKVVGVGSVGTRCYVILYLAESDDPLLLQVKEARSSVLEAYAGKSKFGHHGQRIVIGQRLMQSASDMFLGWMTGSDGTHYYLRQLRDMKYSAQLDTLDPQKLNRYAEVCGWALARSHAKGGDAAMISGYLGKSDAFVKALTKFSLAYADQTERDYHTLNKSVKSGRVQAVLPDKN